MKARNVFAFFTAIALTTTLVCILMYKHVLNIVVSLHHSHSYVRQIPYGFTENTSTHKVYDDSGRTNISSVKGENTTPYKRSEEFGTTTDSNVAKILSNTTLCAETPASLIGRTIDKELPEDLPWTEIEHSGLDAGGRYSPETCKSRYKVAIIIPQRDRLSQLRRLLSHMHPIWKRQQIEYQVYVVTQTNGSIFNRAKLMNVGVAEANQDRQYDCYVFHDVDLFLENDNCMYSCNMDNPRHLAMYMDKFEYKKVTYSFHCSMDGKTMRSNVIQYFGGVSMVSRAQYNDSNGYSNLYWGWGGEDDDFYVRMKNKNFTVVNPYGRKCSYRMIKHEHESANAPNPARIELLKKAHTRMAVDGYNSLTYKVVSKSLEILYTNITVDIGQPSTKLAEYMQNCGGNNGCTGPIPLD